MCVTARAADLPFATGPSPAASAPVAKPLGRPRIGLVLSGGGARGLAHVGVLKVLERERVPVDVIAGTSMGAIIGGLYASGMRAEELEHELLKVQWSSLFASRVERQELSQRRKEEDFEVSPLLELGLRGGELRTPLSAVSSRGLESLLRRYTLRVRSVRRFDELPIPFRAVATDMENGQALVLAEGDLALALRSSMSVPGVFSPTDVNGRILGDGGIVNNVPVDVARTMGADIVIVVNIGTPLAGRDTLGSVLGVTAQTIGILIGQNVERSLASLHADDVLVTPALGTLTSGDFDRTREFIDLGEAGALAALQRLTALAVSPEVYAASVGTRPPVRRPTLDFIGFQGSGDTSPELFASQLESRAGEPFDPDKAERDARALAATGDYLRADYQLVNTAEGDGLVFDLTDKPWGPNYFHVGLDMSTDFTGNSAFNIKIAHNRHWLTRNGTEWRNRLQIGSVPMFSTEIYHPLGLASSLANDWFVAAYAGIERRSLSVYDPDQDVDVELARFRRTTTRVGVDIGQPWGRFGELRAGLTFREADTEPVTVTAKFLGSIQPTRFQEAGLRVRTVIDQLDYAIFPLGGYRMEAEAGYARVSDHERVKRVELQGTYVVSAGAHTLNLNGQARAASGWSGNVLGRYTLGGFQNLSGYLPSQLSGDFLLFTRATWYMRLSKAPTLTRGFFVGASIEAGNAWLTRQEAKLSNLRSGMSVFLGADTGIGPLYLGITHAPQGSTGLTLFIGRP